MDREYLESLTVKELRNILKSEKKRVGGLKKDLIERILSKKSNIKLRNVKSRKSVSFAEDDIIFPIDPRTKFNISKEIKVASCPSCEEYYPTDFPCQIRETIFNNEIEFQEYCKLREKRPKGTYSREERLQHILEITDGL